MSTIKVQDIQHTGNSNDAISLASDSSVALKFSGSTKLVTSSAGVTISDTCTATTFSGSGANLTALPAANITGTLPAIDGSNLTGISSDLVNDTTPQLGGNLETNGFNILIENEKELRLFENSSNSGTNYTALKAASDISSNVTFTLPSQDGSSGHCISTDGSGNLGFRSVQPTIIFDQSSLTTQLMSGNNGILEIKGNTQIAFDRDTSTTYKTYFQANSTQSANVTFTLPAADGSSGQVLKTDGSGVLTFGAYDIVNDTTPQLGGNLDVQSNEINTSTTNGNIILNPNGTGVVEVKGDGTSNGNVGTLQLNCSNNNHGVKIKSPPHSAGASYTLTLPNTDGNANQVLKTDGSGGLDWVDQTTDTNTTYSAGSGLTLTGTTFSVNTLNQDTTGTAAIATTVTVADESSDTTCFPLFVTAATGDLAPKSGSNFAFNSSTGVITATGLTLSGDLVVNGTTTTIDSTNTTIADNLLELNSGASSNANDTGIIIERGSTGDNAIFAWDESADKFIVGTTTATASDTGDLTIAAATLVTSTVEDSKGNLRSIPQNTQGSAYTLDITDAGKHILASGTITVPNNVFSAGDAVTIVNNTSGDLTITKTITTMYLGTDATSANRTLSTRGMATILFASATVAYISGAGLS